MTPRSVITLAAALSGPMDLRNHSVCEGAGYEDCYAS